ncbi:MAG: MotA/TolQ/ExbB proton channel family protein [Panacagrimonas sp.]|nr:MotA/TolQ/ExbB proton channel family protein [Panacagrimonas sp.]
MKSMVKRKGAKDATVFDWIFFATFAPLRLMLLFGLALFATAANAQSPSAKGMDELLEQIQQGSQAAAKLNAEREQRFLRNKNEQAAMLAKAEADHASANARANQAKARFAAGQTEIAELKKRLTERVGDAGQMYAAIAQSAGEFRGQVAGSLATAQFPDRLAFLDRLAAGGEIPGVRDLEQMWFLYAQEAAESGKVARFEAEVVDALGEREKTQVVRVGLFTALDADGFLVLQPESGRLALLPRQPEGQAHLARDFAEASEGLHPVLIDPSRGDLLRLMGERPTVMERIHQGGLVGYVIIAIGVIGAVLAIWQFLYLLLVGGRVRRQLANVTQPRDDNPLGRVLGSLRHDTTQDPEVLETRLSEAVLRETPKLERFQSLLRMIVAAGPLLGLLGTVIGMIITFQVITEVGAGDPKLMAGGISQAMVATVLGLIIAIPLLFVNSFLMSRSRTLTQILDEQAAGLLAQRLEAQGGRRA